MKRNLQMVAMCCLVSLSLGAWADAPVGRYTVTTDTVVDTVTGLTWERTPPANSTSYVNAVARCAALAPAGSWRLPKAKELQSIVDLRMPQPAPSADPVFGAAGGAYWSSTTNANASLAMQVGFTNTAVATPGGNSAWRSTINTGSGVPVNRSRCVR